LIAALTTVPIVAALVLVNIGLRGKWGKAQESPPIDMQKHKKISGLELPGVRRVGVAFLLIIIVIETGALVRWVTYPAFPTEMYSDASWKFARLESALYHTFGLLSPVMIVLIAFSFLYKNY